jgi:hypothetical protein
MASSTEARPRFCGFLDYKATINSCDKSYSNTCGSSLQMSATLRLQLVDFLLIQRQIAPSLDLQTTDLIIKSFLPSKKHTSNSQSTLNPNPLTYLSNVL